MSPGPGAQIPEAKTTLNHLAREFDKVTSNKLNAACEVHIY